MLPIWDRPAIHYIVDELVAAGIGEVLFLIGHGRESLIRYFDGFTDVDIFYRTVPKPLGPADNIMHARSWVGEDDFIVAYCDDVFSDGNPTMELLTIDAPAISVCSVPWADAHKYGVVVDGRIIEKPAEPKSNMVACGRYLLTPVVFDLIADDKCMVSVLNKLSFKTFETKAKRFDIGGPRGLFEVNQFVSRSK